MTFLECKKNFDAVCAKYRDFGTMDTEIRMIFRSLIRKALSGKDVQIPTDASGWEIYSSMDGGDIVACSLAAAALPCVEMAKQASDIVQFAEDW